MESMAVLLVDDEKHILASLRRLLRKEPYAVHTAGSGREGLQVLADVDIHMVVSDQRMPEMEGTEFLQKVKERWPHTVRVVLSGYAEAGAIVEAINKGEVYRFIAKPWNDEELKLTIRQCLEHYRIVTENRTLHEQSARQVAELRRLNTLLESSVAERTRSLQFAQEVLENLPSLILGISQERELVVTNQHARRTLPELAAVLPGTEIDELLPDAAIDAVLACLERGVEQPFEVAWAEHRFRARPSRLGSDNAPRGCILMLEEVIP